MTVSPEFDDLCKLARRNLRAGKPQQAIDLFQKARALDEQQVEVHEGLGTACFMAEDYSAAVEHFTRAIQLNPRRAPAFTNLGAVYNRLENYPKAVETLRKGIILDKKSAEAFYNLGYAYRRMKQLALAIPAYREAIRLNPQMAEAFQNLANVYLDMGNVQQAIVHFKKALEVAPGFVRAEEGLKAAQAALVSAKGGNPFGRLVDQAGLDSGEGAGPRNVSQRELSLAERVYDRQTLQQLLYDIKSHAQQLIDHLTRKIEPGMKELDRALVNERSMRGSVEGSWDRFQPAVNIFRALKGDMTHSFDELRRHEERVADGKLPAS